MGETSGLDFSLTLLLSGIIGMLLLAVALVVFFVVYQRRLHGQQLLRQAAENRHQRELLSAAVEIQENERRRIAGDLHDDIGSQLSAARLYLRQLDPEASSEVNTEVKDATLEIVSRMIQNTRRITHDLMPSELEKFGLFAAAEDLAERLRKTGDIEVDYQAGRDLRFDAKQEVALYRVLQELVNNTLKHAEAQRIEIAYTHQQDDLLFQYLDNGKGFDLNIQNQRGGAGLGLRNIESRVSLVGGQLNYHTAPGEGLRVAVKVPLKNRR
ncbi:MAG: ATP-binding protein [Bacteroidota bacterium]